jgi:hypothetical protein
MRTHHQEGLTREELLMGATRRKRAGWRVSKFRRRPKESSKRSRTLRPEMMDNDASPQTEPTDRILVSSLRFWEVERDLIEERIGAIGRDRSFVRKRHPDWREFPKSRVEVYDDWIPDRLRNLGNNLSVSCLLTGREHRRTPRRKRKDVRRNCGSDLRAARSLPLKQTVVISTVRSKSSWIRSVAYEQSEGRPWQSAPFQGIT